ncbi:MAG: site-specific integrase [Bacteroidetes bacterium]|nr:site-specific integrase [Bacteroidota bacterium]
MFLSKRKNGFYYIVYEKANGVRASRSTKEKLKPKATKFLFEFQKKIELERSQLVTPIRLKQYAFNYLRYSEPYFTDSTMKVYKTTFKYVLNHFGNVLLTELTTQAIEEYLHKRVRDTSIFAARKDLSNLSATLNKAVRDKYLLTNPCTGIKRFKLPERVPMFYSKAEFKKLIDVIEDQDMKDLVIVAVNTGLRQMELIKLEWSQINFKEQLLTLDNRNSITKTKKVRTIPLNDSAFKIIQKRYEKSEQVRIFTLFNAPINQHWLSTNFKKFIYKSGVHPKFNFHSLRHTFASWLVQAGVSIYVVSKLLGHSDIKTTEIYAHLRREEFKSAIDTLHFNIDE